MKLTFRNASDRGEPKNLCASYGLCEKKDLIMKTLPTTHRRVHGLGALLVCTLLHACGGGSGDGSGASQTIDQSALPLVTAGAPYRATLSATGGQGPYRWEVTQGSLPAGLTLNTTTGLIEGQATQVGHFDAEVTVRDASNLPVQATVRIDVVEPDAPLPAKDDRDATQKAGTSTSGSSVTPSAHMAASARTLSATSATATVQTSAALPGLLSLISAMPEGTWVQAGLNSFADVWTPEELRPWDINSGGPPPPSKIIGAWSGFAWDSNRGDLVIYGGGHANYPGNDIYRWRGSTRMWERASLPSDITKDASGNYIAIDGPDAAPAAAHTYDNNIFLPTIDRFLTFGGAAYNNGAEYRRATTNGQSRGTGPYLWDPNKADPNKVGGTTGSHVKRVNPHPEILGGQMWQNRDFRLNLANTPNLPAWHVEGCTGYALESGKDVVYVGARLGYGTAMQLFRYVINDVNNPQLDSWTQLGGYWSSPQGQTVCTYDPVQKIFVKVGNPTTPFTFWDVTAAGGNSNFEKNIVFAEPSGEFAAKLANGQIDIRYCGLDNDPTRHQYALWCGGSDVWMLIPPATQSATGWQLKKQPAVTAGSTPTAATGTGILGKWKYIPNLDAFMALQDSTLGNIWIYKPVGWQPPADGGTINQPPTIALVAPATGAQFTQGTTINLVASAADTDGSVAQVAFYDGTSFLAAGTLSGGQWSYAWTSAAAGSHTIKAIATDNLAAQTTSSTVTIQVNAVNQPPTISLSTPTSDQQFALGQVVSIQANVVDADGSITAVDFYDGTNLLAHVTAAPWKFDWSGAALGSHTLSAVAFDNQLASQTSAAVPVQVIQVSGGSVVLQDGLSGYAGTRDAHLANNAVNVSYGTSTSMIDLYVYYAMMARFAIFNREGGPVPDNAIITSASLELYKATSYSQTLSAYRLLCDWQETQVTWSACRAGVPWATSGAMGAGTDYLAVADGSGLVGWDPGWIKIDVTTGLVAMQAGAPNYGWRLRRTAGDDINTKRYLTREYTESASLRPKLTVTYTVP